MAAKKQIHLNFFDLACTSTHLGIGQWRYGYLNDHHTSIFITEKAMADSKFLKI